MSIFGLSFILFWLNLSCGKYFWINLRNTDTNLYKKVTTTERLAKRLKKSELDLEFLITCRDLDINPKFTRCKYVNNKPFRLKRKFYRKLLIDGIAEKRKLIHSLRRDVELSRNEMLSSTTLMKGFKMKTSISRSVYKLEKRTRKRQRKKLDNLIAEKNESLGLSVNPNPIITNLSSHILSNEEFDILKLGLKHGLATFPKKNDMFAYAEDVWDQITRNKLCKDDHLAEIKIKTCLQAFTFNVIDMDDFRIFKDLSKIKTLKTLRSKVAILKLHVQKLQY